MFLGYVKNLSCFLCFAIIRGKQLRLTQTAVPTLNLLKLAEAVLERRIVNRKSESHVHRLNCTSMWQTVSSPVIDRKRALMQNLGNGHEIFWTTLVLCLQNLCGGGARTR